MRLGISSSLHASDPEEWGRKLQELGCRSAVFPLDHTSDRQTVEAYVEAAARHDLRIAEVGAWCNPVSSDPASRKEALDRCIGQLRLADRIGARCCVNVCGSFGPRWDGGYAENFSQEAWDQTVESIRTIIDAVRPEHTYYAVEPMPWMIPSDPDEYLRLIKEVDRKQFAVHMDVVNWVTDPQKYFFNTRFIEECFSLLGERIRSCHLKDVKLREEYTFNLQEVACGEGSLDLETYAKLADGVSPDMPMLLEHLSTDDQYIASFAYVGKRLSSWL